jgi:outer membrane protein TolC
MKKNFVFFISLVIVNFLWAQQPLTVDQAIATSLANNYDILLSRNDSLLAALDYSYANYAFYPRLNANAGYNLSNNDSKQVLADGTKRERGGIRSSNLAASVNLNWTLFDGLRMFATRKRLGQLVELGGLQIKNQVITTVADVMRTYYDLVRQQQQLRAIEETMQLSEERLKQKSAYLTQQSNILKTKELLNQLLSIPVDTDFNVLDTIPITTSLLLDSIQNGLTGVNPQLLIIQKNLDIANLSLQERRAERLPTVSFNSAYNFTRTDNKSVINPFQPLFNQNRGLNYGFTATIPIFNGLNTRRLMRAAELDIEYQQLQYKRSLSQITTSITNAYKDYDLSKRTLILEEENIKLVRENLFIARERYRLGITTFLEMREAQRSLEEANTRLIQARYNTKIAEIELLRLRGDLVR